MIIIIILIIIKFEEKKLFLEEKLYSWFER